MRISIFGMGYIGTATAAGFAALGHDVTGVDVNPHKVAMINLGQSPIVEDGLDAAVLAAFTAGRLRCTTDPDAAVLQTDVSLISVGTPMGRDGAPMLDALDAVAAGIGAALRRKDGPHIVVLRSTVPPGTTEARLLPLLLRHSGRTHGASLAVAYNPEFMREGQLLEDFRNPPLTIAGCLDESTYHAVEELYRGVGAPVLRTSIRIAESVKYLSNAYHAVKVAFANEAGVLLKSLGVDSHEAMKLFCEDRQLNISSAYLRPGFAFGGSCLPKDASALVALGCAAHLDLPLLSHIMAANDAHIGRALEAIKAERPRKIALLGVAFKPGTDDLRHSPFITLAANLIAEGCEVAIHDPKVHVARLVGKNRDYIDQQIPNFDRLLAPDLATALASADMIVIGHANEAAIDFVVTNHDGRPVLDLQDNARLRGLAGLRYRTLC